MVEMNLDKMDLTAMESKAIYEKIKEYVLEHNGLNVSNLYIAQIKNSTNQNFQVFSICGQKYYFESP